MTPARIRSRTRSRPRPLMSRVVAVLLVLGVRQGADAQAGAGQGSSDSAAGLPADIAFARAVRSWRHVERVSIVGDAAWVVSTSRARGTFEGRAVNSVGAE